MSSISAGQGVTATTGVKTNISGSGVVDSNGNCEIDFLPAPAGSYYTGSVTVYDSPISTSWILYYNGIAIDQATGPSTSAGIQIGPGEQLSLKASNLTAYIGTTFHATYAVISSPEPFTELQLPGHDSWIIPQLIAHQVASGTVVGLVANITCNLYPTDKSLLVLLGTNAGTVTVTVSGNQSGCNYGQVNIPTTAPSRMVSIPAYGVFDTSVNVRITCSTGTVTYTILAGPDDVSTAYDILSNSPQDALYITASPPLQVELTNPSGTQQGTQNNPVGVTEVGIARQTATVSIGVTNVNQALLGPPAAGFNRIVECVSLRNASNAGMVCNFNGAIGGGFLVALDLDPSSTTGPTVNTPFCPRWIMIPGGGNLNVQTAGGTCACYITYHDEPIPS